MTSDDGLEQWCDGTIEAAEGKPPQLKKDDPRLRLWVVRAEDVVHALECGGFADTLKEKKLSIAISQAVVPHIVAASLSLSRTMQLRLTGVRSLWST
ncbi:hypothetical protein RAA17_25295 [Komagataeibacter rhaeticus]|nr:hypothetical protein [Komagataeibacter rhaeticus]